MAWWQLSAFLVSSRWVSQCLAAPRSVGRDLEDHRVVTHGYIDIVYIQIYRAAVKIVK